MKVELYVPEGAGFPRGPGPLVSVLLPTRGRPEGLAHSLDSLFSLSHEPAQIEVLLKIDDDDGPTHELVRRLRGALPGQCRVFSGPRGNGYADMHLWLNQLAAEARGDWLMIWNDDARMATHSWDLFLKLAQFGKLWHGNPGVCLFYLQTEGRPYATEFFLVRREALGVLGYLANGPHADSWVYHVFWSVGSAFQAPVIVRHLQGEGNDATWVEGDVVRKATGPDFNTMAAVRQRLHDALKLMDYVEGKK